MKTSGLDIEMEKFKALMDKAPEIASRALYKGAGVMADEYKRAAAGMPTEKNRYVGPNDPPRHATNAEKNAVVRGIGIARFRKNVDSVDTSVGINSSGYAANIKTKKYPNGKPIPLIANGINSGSSFMVKYPFARKAEASGKAKAVAAMDAEGQKLIDEVTSNG